MLVQLRQGDPVYASDIITTGDSGRMKLAMGDGSTINIAPKSQITIDHYMVKFGYRISGHFNMHWGKARFVVASLEGLDANFSVKGKKVTIKVKGTDFTMIEPDGEGQSQVMLHTGEIIADIVNDPGHIMKAGTIVRINAKGVSTTKAIRPGDNAALGVSILAYSGGSAGYRSNHRPKAAPVAVGTNRLDTKSSHNKTVLSKTHAPKVAGAKIQAPKIQAPKISAPVIHEPKIHEPKIHEPKIHVPKINLPKIHEPKIKPPKVKGPKL